jgi:hypothetical protein
VFLTSQRTHAILFFYRGEKMTETIMNFADASKKNRRLLSACKEACNNF